MKNFRELYCDQRYIISEDNRKEVVLRDKGESRKYIGKNMNQNTITIYRVDGGILPSNDTNKCDFAFTINGDGIFFVELKGSDLSHACLQILNTITNLIDTTTISYKFINARIVLSRVTVPNIKVTNEKLLGQLIKKHKGTYLKQNRVLEENLGY